MIKESNIIRIALSSDSKYIIPIMVLLQSVFDNNSQSKVHIYLFYFEGHLSTEDILLIKKNVESRSGNFTSVSINEDRIKGFPVFRHGINVYLRLFLPELLQSIEKVLFLDGDIIVRGSLKELFETNVSSYYLAAVKDSTSFYSKDYQESIGIGSDHYYFNAGVVLLNLEEMRKICFFDKAIRFISSYYSKIADADQAVLNYISYPDHVKYISPKFNLNFNVEKDIMSKIADKGEIEEAKRNPVIVHFIGQSKPWSALCIHPYRHEWWRYLKKTKFSDFVPEDQNLLNRFYRIYLWTTKSFEHKISLETKRKIGRLIPEKIKKIIKLSMKKKI